jgi:hypothetical protein
MGSYGNGGKTGRLTVYARSPVVWWVLRGVEEIPEGYIKKGMK